MSVISLLDTVSVVVPELDIADAKIFYEFLHLLLMLLLLILMVSAH